MITTTEKMTLRKWYGNSIRIPYLNSWQFGYFLTSSIGIINSIIKRKMEKEVVVRFAPDLPSAAADHEGSRILINSRFIDGKFGVDRKITDSDQVATAILGVIVHEAAHFAYSPATLDPWVEAIKKHSTAPFHEQIAGHVGNIIEDVYIEAEVDRDVPALTWLLDSINGILFTLEDEVRALSFVEELTESPKNLIEVAAVLDCLILAKTRRWIPTNPYVQRLFELVKQADGMSSLEGRVALGLQVYNELMRDVVIEECEQPGGPGSDEAEVTEILKKLAEHVAGITSSGSSTVDRDFDGPRSQLNTALDSLEGSEVLIAEDELDENSHLFIIREMAMGVPVVMNDRYTRLEEVARQNAVVNKPYGLDQKRGTSIRKLHRIATDQKIFAEVVPMKSVKPMQVIILVDCSGSMSNVVKIGSSLTRIQAACEAALGAAWGLAEARCDVSVYGHTADVTVEGDITIYQVKSFNDSLATLSQRLGYMLNECAQLENRDGHAIQWVGNKFTDPRKRRLLIVISDGAPEAPGYVGFSAIEHTRKSVELVRSRGIDVLSISITPGVSKVNNKIYGERWNTTNDDPNVLIDIVQALVIK